MWDLRSTQWCCQVFRSFVIWHSVKGWADSRISKDHGAFIHTTGQSIALCLWMNGYPHFKESCCPHPQHSNCPTRTANLLAPLRPHKHTMQPIPHLLQLACHLLPPSVKWYLLTCIFPYLPSTGCSSQTAWLLKIKTLWSFKSFRTTHPTQCHIPKTWIVNYLSLGFELLFMLYKTWGGHGSESHNHE